MPGFWMLTNVSAGGIITGFYSVLVSLLFSLCHVLSLFLVLRFLLYGILSMFSCSPLCTLIGVFVFLDVIVLLVVIIWKVFEFIF